MGQTTRWAILGASLLCAAGTAGCDNGVVEDIQTQEESDVRRLAEMRAEILVSIEDLSCAKAADCATIALGDKPCGGPWEYLVYSRAAVDEQELTDAVDAYNRYNRELNQRWSWDSDCALAQQPGTDCVSEACAPI